MRGLWPLLILPSSPINSLSAPRRILLCITINYEGHYRLLPHYPHWRDYLFPCATKLKDTTVPCQPQFLKLNVFSLSCPFGNFLPEWEVIQGPPKADFDCEVFRSNDDSERTVFLLLGWAWLLCRYLHTLKCLRVREILISSFTLASLSCTCRSIMGAIVKLRTLQTSVMGS